MNLILRVPVFLLLCWPPFSQQIDPIKSGSISGTVIDRTSSQPVPKARVTLLPSRDEVQTQPDDSNEHHMSVSDEKGHFELRGIRPGNYWLTGSRIGYIESGRTRVFITLTPGQGMSNTILRLTRTGVISGRVVDEQGEPLVAAEVVVSKRLKAERPIERKRAAGGQVDDRGEFRIFDLTPGKYYLWVRTQKTPYVPTKHGMASDWTYPITYYPSVSSPEAALTIELPPGGETRIDLTVAPVRTGCVSGRVLGTAPTASVPKVMMLRSDRFEPRTVQAKADGSFELCGVVSGKYKLIAFVSFEDETERANAERTIVVGEQGLNNVELTLQPVPSETELHGIVRAEGPARQALDDLSVMLYKKDQTEDEFSGNGMTLGGSNLSGLVKEDGTFTIRNVSAAPSQKVFTLIWAIGGYDDFYTKAVYYDGQDVTNTGFTPTADGLLEIMIASDGGRVSGIVRNEDQEPVVQAIVLAVPGVQFRHRRELFKTSSTDHAGRFVLRGLSPGEYTLLAWDSAVVIDYTDPEFLKLYEFRGQRLRVPGSGENSVALKVIDTLGE